MPNEEGRNPLWKKQDIQLNGSVTIKLKCGKPLAEGNNSFGHWNLFVVEVDNKTVYEGRGADQKEIKNYSGEAVTFFSDFDVENINDKISEANNYLYNSEWKITKSVVEGKDNKLMKNYNFELIKEGEPYQSSDINQSDLTVEEQQLLNDAQELINEGHLIKKELFIKAAKEPQYKNKISEDRAAELYKYLQM